MPDAPTREEVDALLDRYGRICRVFDAMKSCRVVFDSGEVADGVLVSEVRAEVMALLDESRAAIRAEIFAVTQRKG